ncbi:MAG: cellulase family glycosylhydrolase, partial [Armatimonadetes bacterium]|nr:cellulase family glycosylhydrolase [Armatimonadota bacterium]
AAQLDFVLAHCDRLGLQVMLCLDYHGALRQAESWAQNPYARARGGPCISTRDFFSNTGARKLYQNRLRYLAARYAASPSLGMWELFNEVDLTDPYPFCEREIARWHARMSRYLRSVDPYRHLVTTSVARAHTEEEHLWADRDMDVVQAHRYPGWRSLSVDTARALDLLQRYRRPRLLTEFGLDRDAARSFDPRGEGLLEAFWAGSLQGAAAAPMPWWWDSYIDELDLYHRLTGLARFLQDIDFPGESFRPLTGVSVETLPGAAARPANLLLQPEQSSFEPASFNQQRRFRVLPDGRVEGDAPLAELLHGTKAHPSLHNPQSFEVEYPADGFFTVLITEVSNWASTEVQVLVDSRVAFHRLFPDEDPGRGVQYRFNGACRVPVSAGRHTIVVKNEGGDWIRVAYVLESYVAPATSAVALYGLSGKSTILAWARHRGHTYYTRSLGVEAAPLDGIGLRWKRLPPGPWDISVWDPATGEVLARATATAVNGEVRIPLPAFLDGVAVKLVRRDVSGDLVSRFGSPPELPNRETR